MANNKSGIDTEKYLSGVIPSSYSRILGIPFPDSLDEGLITGAKNVILPMTITMGDRNNDKISFVFLINPENVNHGKTNSVYASMARTGFITQMWGPNQDLLTATGKTAGFYAYGVGLTNISRQRSFGFKNFMALFSTYRNNGYEFLDTTNLNNLTRVINIVHGIKIDYDGQTLLGHFNNFTLDENAENPYLFNYNFEFVVSSLSDDYNEIKGHFIPPGEKIERKKPRLISKVGKSILNTGEQFEVQPTPKIPVVTSSGSTVGLVYAKGKTPIPDAAGKILIDTLNSAGLPGAFITSTVRTPASQAAAMYKNAKENLPRELKLYGAYGDAVLKVYQDSLTAGDDQATTIAKMESLINKQGINVWEHLSPYTDTMVVCDINPESIGPIGSPERNNFENAMKNNKNISFIPPPKDKVYHIRINPSMTGQPH
jgi:hypothetical protein